MCRPSSLRIKEFLKCERTGAWSPTGWTWPIESEFTTPPFFSFSFPPVSPPPFPLKKKWKKKGQEKRRFEVYIVYSLWWDMRYTCGMCIHTRVFLYIYICIYGIRKTVKAFFFLFDAERSYRPPGVNVRGKKKKRLHSTWFRIESPASYIHFLLSSFFLSFLTFLVFKWFFHIDAHRVYL